MTIFATTSICNSSWVEDAVGCLGLEDTETIRPWPFQRVHALRDNVALSCSREEIFAFVFLITRCRSLACGAAQEKGGEEGIKCSAAEFKTWFEGEPMDKLLCDDTDYVLRFDGVYERGKCFLIPSCSPSLLP